MNYIQKKFANGEVNLSPHHVRRALDFVLNSERQIRFKRHVFHLWNAGYDLSLKTLSGYPMFKSLTDPYPSIQLRT